MIHYMTGDGMVNCKRVALRPVQVKGGLKSVYWADREKVTCPECRGKVGRLIQLQQSKLTTKP